MNITEEALEGCLLTEESIRRDLEELASCYEAMEMKSQIIPPMEDAPIPNLVAALPDDDEGRPRIITHSFVPIDKEDAEYTKLLQFYVVLQDPLEGIDRATLLEAINRLNFTLPLGAAVLTRDPGSDEEKVSVRMVQGYPINESINRGVFTEDMILFDLSCTLTSIVITALAGGQSIDEAFATLGR